MQTCEITLTPVQIEYADKLAHLRQANADRQQRIGGNGAVASGAAALQLHILGARCEGAAKLYLNPIHWNQNREGSRAKIPDLGNFIEVRGRDKKFNNLIVKPRDPETWAYLLVSGAKHPTYLIIGWMYGHEAKEKKYWLEPVANRGAFFVDREDLRKPETLRQKIHA